MTKRVDEGIKPEWLKCEIAIVACRVESDLKEHFKTSWRG